MRPRLLFLDFDGVLTTPSCIRRGLWWFSRACISHLNDLCAMAPASIIITSSWRRGHSLPVLRRLLRLQGFWFAHRVVSITPTKALPGCGSRGQEINAWFDENGRCKEYVVLDDDSDIYPFRHRHVHVNFKLGLQAADTISAVRLLGIRVGRR